MVDTAEAHGAPFAPDEIARTKELMGLPADEAFHVPDDVATHWRGFAERGRAEREAWEARRDAWTGDRDVLEACLAGRGLPGWEAKLPTWDVGTSVATRNASRDCLNGVIDNVPGLVAGSADLTGNTGVAAKGVGTFSADDRGGRLVHYGVREHAMGAAMNGMALHGGVLPVGGTFFVFSDYMRPAVRLAAISGAHVVFSWSHDSVGIGEDGPTHQPIEHLASLRAMPGLRMIRPADANETATAWRAAIDLDGPTALVLSRQNLPVLEGTAGNDGVLRGAYVLRPADDPAIVLVGTGSEVAVALEAAERLAADGVSARVVSMPCWELFEDQDPAYRREVLGEGIPRLAVEAGTTFGWARWVDDAVGIDRFGASAPGDEALRRLGIEPGHVVERARALLASA
jgi:transketolase